MGQSYFSSVSDKLAWDKQIRDRNAQEDARIADERRKLAAKVVMVIVDRIVNEIVRPGPKPEERECYVMAGELRAIVPDLEELAKKIIDVNDGVE